MHDNTDSELTSRSTPYESIHGPFQNIRITKASQLGSKKQINLPLLAATFINRKGPSDMIHYHREAEVTET